MQLIREMAGKIIAALIVNILVSVGMVFFLVGAFQSALDTTSNAIQGQVLLVASQVSDVNVEIETLSQSANDLTIQLAGLERTINDMVSTQEQMNQQFAQDVRALATSTDFLIERANRIIAGTVPSAPLDLGSLEEGDRSVVETDANGLVSVVFDIREASQISVGLAQELGEPALARVSLYASSDLVGNAFSRRNETLFGIGGLSRSAVDFQGIDPGRYLVVVESMPLTLFSIAAITAF